LSASHESPLVLGDLSEPANRRVAHHSYCKLAHK
jgi:hypothetical protein